MTTNVSPTPAVTAISGGIGAWRPRSVRIARADGDPVDALVVGRWPDALQGDHLWHSRVAADVTVSAADRARSAVRGCGLPHLVDEHLGASPDLLGVGRPPTAGTTARDGVVVLLAAAWIHTGGPPPTVLDLCLPRPVRARFGPVRFRAARLSSRDVVLVGGVRATSPLSTACDLARAAGSPDPAGHGCDAGSPTPEDGRDRQTALEALRALLGTGVAAEAVEARLLTDRRAHSRRARLLVASL